MNKAMIERYTEDTRMYIARYKTDGIVPTRGPAEAQRELIVGIGCRVMLLVNLKVNRGK